MTVECCSSDCTQHFQQHAHLTCNITIQTTFYGHRHQTYTNWAAVGQENQPSQTQLTESALMAIENHRIGQLVDFQSLVTLIMTILTIQAKTLYNHRVPPDAPSPNYINCHLTGF